MEKFEEVSEILEVSKGMYLGKISGSKDLDIVPVIWNAEVASGRYLLDRFQKDTRFKCFECPEGYPKIRKCVKTIVLD